MRLIDADKIKKSVTNKMFNTELHSPVYNTLECVIADIDNQPTAFDLKSVITKLKTMVYRIDDSATLCSRDVINEEDVF